MNLKTLFKENEWNLITNYVTNPSETTTWLDYAEKFNIKPEGTNKQRRTAANDIYRRFLKLLERHNQTVESIFQPESFEGLEVSRIIVDHKGQQTTTYVRPKGYTGPLDTEKVIDILFQKHTSRILDFNEKKKRAYAYLEKEEKWFGGTKGTEPGTKLAIVNLYDAHLDKLPIKSTCGVDSTLEQNIKTFLKTIDQICISMVNEDIKEVIFPVGNDLFHTNGFNSQTKKGTQIEYYGSPEESYYAICDAITEAIHRIAVVPTGKVKVLMIKGNHDEDKITTLGYWLEKLFKDTNVEVDYLRKQRKYIKFGENLIGFAHGDKEKSKIAQLPLLMAQENKVDWGTTTHRKMYLGDLHHGFEYQFLKAKDMPGVEIEYLRSVGTTDTWHEDFGWIGIPKTAYLQIFDAEDGEIIRKKFNIK